MKWNGEMPTARAIAATGSGGSVLCASRSRATHSRRSYRRNTTMLEAYRSQRPAASRLTPDLNSDLKVRLRPLPALRLHTIRVLTVEP